MQNRAVHPGLLCSLIAAALCAIAPRAAFADPIVVGPLDPLSTVTFDYEGDGFRLTGQGFSAQTVLDTWGFNIPRVQPESCVICAAGDTLNPGFHTPGEVDLWHGSATIGATTYSDVAFRGSFDFQVAPISFPTMTDQYYFPQLPFTFTGVLRGFSAGQEVFAQSLTGSGTTRQTFFRFADTVYEGRYQDEYGNRAFVFANDSAPVPEPATMILLGTGLAGVIARTRRSRSKAS